MTVLVLKELTVWEGGGFKQYMWTSSPSLGFSRQEHWSGLPFPSSVHESEVAQSYRTLRDPTDCSPPGSSIQGIFQARVLGMGCHHLLRRKLLGLNNNRNNEDNNNTVAQTGSFSICFLPPLRHMAGLHFPASLALRHDHVTDLANRV